MVCKEEVIEWFRSLRSNNRIDVMCTLLNLCLPFELRFLGTCLEELGKRDFHDLRKTENEANNLSDINEVQCISDKRTRPKLAFYISLLHSCNYACCNGLYKILSNFDEVNALLKSPTIISPDDNTLEELLLIYTLALNHPAFTFDQKLCLGNIFTRLQEEENKRSALLNQSRRISVSSGIDSISDKISLQSCPDDRHVHANAVSNTSHCPPLANSVASHLTGEPVINLHDQLNSGSYHVRLAGYPQPAPLLGGHASWPGMMSGVLPPEPTTSPSPLVNSRTSSPCQSNSPSRAGSPGRPKPPLSGPYPRPPPADPLRETIGKEMPNYLANLQDYSIEQIRQMSDDELLGIGLPNGAIFQLRSIVNKLQATNGITNLIDMPPNINNNNKKKVETCEPEVPVMRRFTNILEGSPAYFSMPPQSLHYAAFMGCLGCQQNIPRPHKCAMYCITEQMRAMQFEPECPNSLHCSNSSASDSASDHSPPDTPSLSNVSDRGSSKEPGEVWTGGDEREQRVGMPVDNLDDRRPNSAHPNSQQGRSRGIGRNRSNPPGIQTLPRGRGMHPSAQRRREMGCSNSVNGAPDDRKLFGGNEVQPFPYNPGAPAPAPPYMPHAQFIRAATATYPAFHPGSYVRPSFPFAHPNSGDMVYQYPPPSQAAFLPPGPAPTPTPQPAPISYSAIVPPLKISCYNCGSQSHLPVDCPESTIEEVSKQGQYRIDYTYHQKSGECSSTTNNSEK